MVEKLVTEDWKKEYEKIILIKKYSRASTLIGIASSTPTLDNARTAYGFVVDFVTALPIPDDKKLTAAREGFLKELDEINLILYGNPAQKEVRELLKKHKIGMNKVRQGLKMMDSLQNLPNLIKAIRSILIRAWEFATSVGLVITLAKPRTFGVDRILDEEGFSDLEIEEFA